MHHVDENPRNNTPTNLVVCPDQAYHMLLHKRMRALDACGHADWSHCQFCGRYDAPEALTFSTSNGASYHKPCRATYMREKAAERRQPVAA